MTDLELAQVKSQIYMDLDCRLFELRFQDGGLSLDDVFEILRHQINKAIFDINLFSEDD